MNEEATIYTGEKCSVCGQPASHKIGEEFAVGDPRAMGHNLTSYVCEDHFNMVICPYKPRSISKDMNDAINHLDALETYHSLTSYHGGYYKEKGELIELLKVSLRNLRNKEVGGQHEDREGDVLRQPGS